MRTLEMTDHHTFLGQLRQRSVLTPHKAFMRQEERVLSYAQTLETVEKLAGLLSSSGLRAGDRCVLLMRNGIDYALLWLALARAGVVSVPINQAYKGALLAHQVRDVDARALIADAQHWPRIAEIIGDIPRFEMIFDGASGAQDPQGEQTLLDRDFRSAEPIDIWGGASRATKAPIEVPHGWDTLSIFYTSGTTGASKGVLYTHTQAWHTAYSVAQYLTESDIFYMTNPMCHVSLPHCLGAALLSGGTIAIREKFSVREFWRDVRAYQASVTMMLGSVANFVTAQPAREDDRAHTLRKVLMVPVLKDVEAFCERFGVEVMSWFNMTEVSVPLHTDGFLKKPGMGCGTPRAGASARIVDEHDRELAPGKIGELLVRDDGPWAVSPGYWNNPEATLSSQRNQWFHTGDLFLKDDAGQFFFVDRMKDSIRRRGENISSYEVEAQIASHESVLEAAVIGVPSADGEQEVKAVVVLREGARELRPSDLLDFLQSRLPYFCVPRFVLIQTDPLPRTETGKVKKHVLRESQADPGWDRESHGYRMKR